MYRITDPRPDQSSADATHVGAPGWLVRRRRWLTVLLAMATASLVAGLAELAPQVDLAVRLDGTTRSVSNLGVNLVTLAAGLVGWASLAVLERRTPHARRVWTVLAVLVLLISFAGPLAAVGVAATLVLLGLHVLVGVIVIVGMRGSTSVRVPTSEGGKREPGAGTHESPGTWTERPADHP